MIQVKPVASSMSRLLGALGMMLALGCHANNSSPTTQTAMSMATTAPAVAPAAVLPTIRIDAGSTTPLKDPDGNMWLADTGFADGDVIDRGDDTAISGTNNPELYRTEHWGMTGFSFPVPNGSYTVKLHFAETSDLINGPGDRVFSFSLGGHDFDNFDVWVKAGNHQKAYIETVPVVVTDGKLSITFTQGTQETEINGIEIIPN